MERNRDAEKNIINAARKVFHNKGYKDATMRDIASEAKINLAMVNYYFRSKENLFYIIFDETLSLFYNKIDLILGRIDIDIKEKIRMMIDEYSIVFSTQSYLPFFIINEIVRNPERISTRFKIVLQQSNAFQTFNNQLQSEIKEGSIKQVSAFSILLNILSLIIFPVLAKPVIEKTLNISTDEMNTALELRRKEVAELIINSIKT